MHEGGGKLGQIDIVVAHDIFEHRPALDHARRRHLEFFLHARLVSPHNIHAPARLGQAQHMGEALVGIGGAREHAEALRIAGNIVEQDRRLLARIAHRHRFGERAHLEVAVGPVDLHHLAHALEISDEIAQALVGRASVDAR